LPLDDNNVKLIPMTCCAVEKAKASLPEPSRFDYMSDNSCQVTDAGASSSFIRSVPFPVWGLE
jgi:hypothetical protein